MAEIREILEQLMVIFKEIETFMIDLILIKNVHRSTFLPNIIVILQVV